jgi:NTE family protein
LFGNATLQDLPDDARGEGPRFVINATNVQTGALWRFSRPFMGDYKVGLVKTPAFSLASAVTASSAFPPVLSPVQLDLSGFVFQPDSTTTLQKPAFTSKVMLSDGGVYDNMGLETAWKHSKTLLVSDAGAPFAPDESPHTDWARHSIRVLDLIDNQVRARRRIELIEAFKAGTVHNGAYWGIKTRLNDYPQPGNLPCADAAVKELAATPTRLKALDQAYQSRLINWGYAVAAAALSSHFPGPIAKPAAFPYPGGI